MTAHCPNGTGCVIFLLNTDVSVFPMSRATSQMRSFAKRLITDEALGNRFTKPGNPDVFSACERLRPPLAALMGNGGFQALQSRALALSGAAIPWMGALHVKSDGSLGGLEEIRGQLSADAFLAGRVELLAQLLGLLVAFIGEDLTLRLVREVWPKAPLDNLNLANGDKR